MQRVTVTLDDDLLAALDALAAQRRYGSRSEAVRDIVRTTLSRESVAHGSAASYATLSYVYDHDVRDLARRLTHEQHEHHDLTVASLHVHLDRERCLEVSVLHGPSGELHALSDAVTTQRGVRFGHLHLIPDEAPREHEAQGGHTHQAAHRKRA